MQEQAIKNKKIKLKHLLGQRIRPLSDIEIKKGQWFLSHLYKWDAALTEKMKRVIKHAQELRINGNEKKIQNNNYWKGLMRKYDDLDKQSTIILQQIEKLIQVLAQ
jgi:hypothetical protein